MVLELRKPNAQKRPPSHRTGLGQGEQAVMNLLPSVPPAQHRGELGLCCKAYDLSEWFIGSMENGAVKKGY
jgi:hypothetical protein